MNTPLRRNNQNVVRWVLRLAAGLLLLWGAPCARAETAPAAVTQAFAEAQKAYDAGEPGKAVEGLEAIVAGGWIAPEVFFNLGNAYFRAGKPGLAVLNYRRALWLNPGDADLRANFQFAVERAGASVPEPWLAVEFLRSLSRETWKRVALLGWWSGGLLLALGLFNRRVRLPLPAVLGGASLLVVLGLLGMRAAGSLATTREAVVLAANLEMKSAPTADSTALVRLPEGSIVHIQEDGGSWLRVRSDKDSGWLPAQKVGRVAL